MEEKSAHGSADGPAGRRRRNGGACSGRARHTGIRESADAGYHRTRDDDAAGDHRASGDHRTPRDHRTSCDHNPAGDDHPAGHHGPARDDPVVSETR
ncbi:hypothetical protein NWFMUON74_14400 [Nocardia wallacei]|uniref:Uncharacterized protein n=1 Tax=Nocardia wallacei TaxID=480035 RepID=A0A7G1KEZ8_9NOCA|nr:hypothetical protein NWFMUON74_14400 [Nocardia wallacei]